MAKRAEPKSPIKPVYFRLEDPEELELRKHADGMINYSDWVKAKLREDKLVKEMGPPEQPGLDPQELAALVESLLETKLAGRIVATDQGRPKLYEVPSGINQFF